MIRKTAPAPEPLPDGDTFDPSAIVYGPPENLDAWAVAAAARVHLLRRAVPSADPVADAHALAGVWLAGRR